MGELDLSRQSKLVPVEALTTWNFHIFGVGSVGSHVAKLLSKTGFKNLTVYDMDKVESPNIGPQAFDFRHMGKLKTEAMVDIIKEVSGVEAKGINGKVDDNTIITPEPNTMYLCFFDSFEGRKIVYNKVKDYPVIFVDGRIGRFDMKHFLIELSDEEQKQYYMRTFPTDDNEGSELQCGEKASAFINYLISSLIVTNIINYVSGNTYEKSFAGNALQSHNNMRAIMRR